MSGVRAYTAADLPQGSAGWHQLRRARVGSSEVSIIGERSPYGTQGEVWAYKRGAPVKDRPRDLYLRVGHALEQLAAELLAEQLGVSLAPGLVIAEERGLMLASQDRRAGGVPVECKVRFRGAPDYGHWTPESIPGHVDVQLTQAVLLHEQLTGQRIDVAHVSALLGDAYGLTHRTYEVEMTPARRETWLDLWRPTVTAWWRAYVLTGERPPDATHEDVAVLVSGSTTTRRDATPEEEVLLEQLRGLDAARADADKAAREATKTRNAVRDELARALGPDHTIPGLSWQATGRGKFCLRLEH